jgi:hypothetical protein
MNNLVSISLYSMNPNRTSPGWFLVVMIVLIGFVFYLDHRKDKKDGYK